LRPQNINVKVILKTVRVVCFEITKEEGNEEKNTEGLKIIKLREIYELFQKEL
jgi:hypothetical protein